MRRRGAGQPRLAGFDVPPFENRGLFTDRFLTGEGRLDVDPDWCEPKGLAETFQALQREWQECSGLLGSSTNEPQTEENWIKPVLRALGWEWEVQQPVRGVSRRPDYALLFSTDDKASLQPLKNCDAFWEHVPVLADAKAWDLPLDRRSGDETPSIQIAQYLYHSGVRWGILTNGRIWRLYEREKSRGGGAHFQVDLISLLEDGTADNFRWFYCFFSPQAFRCTAEQPCFVQRVLENSRLYAAELGDHVRESVYDALRHLMTGFLRHPNNGLEAADPATVQRVHDLALIVLYRLLFLLYAEDAGLLPAAATPGTESFRSART